MIGKLTYIDLFAGGGGLAEGFHKAGFTAIAHVEENFHACKTLETRFLFNELASRNKQSDYLNYIKGEITRERLFKKYEDLEIQGKVINKTIGGENNDEIFKSINLLLGNQKLDVVVGGPPCQAYSLVGRSRAKDNMKNDPRNFLYREYAKFLVEFKPKVFVFENVIGLITADKGSYFSRMQEHFRGIGYELDYTIQKSEEFGVLQKRRRIILIGWRKGFDFSYPIFNSHNHDFTTKELFTDLKKLKPGDDQNVTKYTRPANEYLSAFGLRNGADFVTQHITRPHNKRDLAIYKIAIDKLVNKGERLKYPDLPQELKTHKNETSFVDRFKVVNPNDLCHTMVAHIAKDGHHYIYPDLNQVRSISVREAARVQSFPDDYYFEGGRSAAFRQIGNAVPPLMAYEIAKQIKAKL